MKNMIKKLGTISLSAMVAILSLGAMSACIQYENPNITHKLETYEEGYFLYSTHKRYGVTEAYITGLSALGKEQRALVIPQTINGIELTNIGYSIDHGIGGWEEFGGLVSEKLEKIFFAYEYPDLKKQIKGHLYLPNCDEFIFWRETDENRLILETRNVVVGQNFILNDYQTTRLYQYRKIANVSYMYNFEGAPNGGWYWVDNYAESVIWFIPPEPQREGYTFGGWYKEAECVNAWDFENDVTGEEIVLEPYNYNHSKYKENYTGTYLYAKWEAIN